MLGLWLVVDSGLRLACENDQTLLVQVTYHSTGQNTGYSATDEKQDYF